VPRGTARPADARLRGGRPGWLTGAEAQAAACDATIVPVVIGHIDWAALGQLTDAFAGADQRPLNRAGRRRLARALLGLAIDTLSGPGGLAAALRTGLPGRKLSLATPLTSISLPLDIGAGSEAIPAHLRRAVTIRHPHCAFPGCAQPASLCDVHHLIPRSAGGATALPNLVPLCRFHHLIAIHHWGWTLRLNPDATTTATSPDGHRIWHSHSPPTQAA
jgi:HNH endonuclease